MATAVSIILIAAGMYLLSGVLFAIFFLRRGMQKIDAAVHGSSWGFRFIILPGIIVFWPVLLNKWLKKLSHDKIAS
jgi:hypothetical protein